MKKLVLLLPILIFACQPTESSREAAVEERSPVQQVVDRAIDVSGGENYTNSRITFDFRDISYVGERRGGLFSYERIIQDSLGEIHDVLTNDSFTRHLNGEAINVIDTMAQKYTNSVNSVLYFALIPYGLNDAAVFKSLVGEIEIDGKDYQKVRITFQEEGGGVDYQDVFVYWVDKATGFIDYFGYTYETDGGGVRFREAYNSRIINGIRFQDYINYKPMDGDSTAIQDYDQLLLAEELIELSRIELKNINVDILDSEN